MVVRIMGLTSSEVFVLSEAADVKNFWRDMGTSISDDGKTISQEIQWVEFLSDFNTGQTMIFCVRSRIKKGLFVVFEFQEEEQKMVRLDTVFSLPSFFDLLQKANESITLQFEGNLQDALQIDDRPGRSHYYGDTRDKTLTKTQASMEDWENWFQMAFSKAMQYIAQERQIAKMFAYSDSVSSYPLWHETILGKYLNYIGLGERGCVREFLGRS